MISDLRGIISSIAGINDVKVPGYVMDKIRLVEKHVDEDEDIDNAMLELDKILGFQWNELFADIRDRLEKAKRK